MVGFNDVREVPASTFGELPLLESFHPKVAILGNPKISSKCKWLRCDNSSNLLLHKKGNECIDTVPAPYKVNERIA